MPGIPMSRKTICACRRATASAASAGSVTNSTSHPRPSSTRAKDSAVSQSSSTTSARGRMPVMGHPVLACLCLGTPQGACLLLGVTLAGVCVAACEALAALDVRLVAVLARRADALVEELVALVRFVLDAAVLRAMAPLPAKRRLVRHRKDFAGHAVLYAIGGCAAVAAPGAMLWRGLPRRDAPTRSSSAAVP